MLYFYKSQIQHQEERNTLHLFKLFLFVTNFSKGSRSLNLKQKQNKAHINTKMKMATANWERK